MGVYEQMYNTAYPNVTVSGISGWGKQIGVVTTALTKRGYLSCYVKARRVTL
jgi:hypothetical protein